jgi:peptidoglycan/xylan/chitin deacetylase (PgdA/CDA1 family)
MGNAKRLVKLLISILYFAWRSLGNALRRIAGKAARGSAVILYYHRVRPDQRAMFAAQLDTIMKWTKPVDLGFRSLLRDGGRFAAVTFDDGFTSFTQTALPEMRKRGIPSTLFVVAGKLGCYPEWDEYIEDPLFKEPIMTQKELLGLPQDLVTIGSHTLTHPFLTRIDETEAKRELRESRIALEKMLGRKVVLFSFPHGDHHARMIDWCRESGYEHVFTILPEPAFCVSDKYVVGRVGVDPTDWPIEFLMKLLGAYSWLPAAFALKRRLYSSSLVRRSSDLKPIAQ